MFGVSHTEKMLVKPIPVWFPLKNVPFQTNHGTCTYMEAGGISSTVSSSDLSDLLSLNIFPTVPLSTHKMFLIACSSLLLSNRSVVLLAIVAECNPNLN